ncbi:MAG: hypothetical protein ACR2HO_01340 [Rubrobacteraceae bacterium]
MRTLFELRDTVVVELRRKMRDIMESFPYPVLNREQDPLDFLPPTPLYR